MYTLIALVLLEPGGFAATTRIIESGSPQHLRLSTVGTLIVIGSFPNVSEARVAERNFAEHVEAHRDPFGYVIDPFRLIDLHYALLVRVPGRGAIREVWLKQGGVAVMGRNDSFLLHGGFPTAKEALRAMPLAYACRMRRRAFEQTSAEA